MTDLAPHLKELAELWPEKPPLLVIEATDIRPFVELQELLLTTIEQPSVRMAIRGSKVFFALTIQDALIFALAPNTEAAIDHYIDATLELRKKL